MMQGPGWVNRVVSAMSAVSPLYPRQRTSSVRPATSEKCRYCCKTLFAAWDTNSPSRRCDDWMTTWGTTLQRAKLMGDSGIGFEALSTGDCRLFRSSARNWPLRLLGLLQHYLPEAGLLFQCVGAGAMVA